MPNLAIRDRKIFRIFFIFYVRIFRAKLSNERVKCSIFLLDFSVPKLAISVRDRKKKYSEFFVFFC